MGLEGISDGQMINGIVFVDQEELNLQVVLEASQLICPGEEVEA